MERFIRILALGLIAALLLLWGGVWWAYSRNDPAARSVVGRAAGLLGLADGGQGGLPGGLELGGPFHLVDQDGKPVSDADFRGRWMLVFFGYTSCPDICPTELQTMAAALDKLGPLADRVAPIFVTVDPKRDTPAVLAAYVKQFDPRIRGLSGTPAQLADVAREYRVYYAPVTSKAESTYTMDHSSLVYLADPEGRVVALFNPGTGAEALADALRARLAAKA